MTSTLNNTTEFAKNIPLRFADNDELNRLSREGMLSMTLDEMKVIQRYFLSMNRDPTDIELETLAQTWSEHCVHKTFKGRYIYSENELNGGKALVGFGLEKTFSNLLKDTIVKVTEQLNFPWCLSVFKDNAGVIEFDADDAVSFKVETHNHPSALEPYGGAGTGVGGVIRDVLGCGLGGKPVLNTDIFCFGHLDTSMDQLPEGALSPKRIAQGVVAGVRDYGNRMGIPTANGAIYFDNGYIGNPLVFCGTVGFMPKNAIEKSVEPGDWVVAIGGRTGRDGIHGATFSSAPLERGISSSVVQLGHAINEKKVLDVLLQARHKRLYRSVTDCGAGGFSSAVGELGKDTGVEVWLDKAPLKYPGLAPWEIWVSESQERMVLAVPDATWQAFRTLCEQEDVEAVIIGKFTNDKKLVVKFNEQLIASLDMEFLHDGVPKVEFRCSWDAKAFSSKFGSTAVFPHTVSPDLTGVGKTLEALLAHPNIASKETVVRQYDHEVQGGSVVKPYMGVFFDGPTDAAVIRPKLTSWRGIGVSNGLNPEIGKWDPYLMAKMAVDEAYRNLICVGGALGHVAILDNFCWGNSKDPLELAGLVRAAEGCLEAALAYRLPFISGKDSFNNTWKSPDGTLRSIPPTLVVSAIGILSDVRHCITAGFKHPGHLIYIVGETLANTKGTLAGLLWGQDEGKLPDVKLEEAFQLYRRLQIAMKHQLVFSCHDCSEGGIGVALSEMAFGGQGGVELEFDDDPQQFSHRFFSETPSRFVVEVSPNNRNEFEQTMGIRSVTLIGKTTKNPVYSVTNRGVLIMKAELKTLKNIWKKSLEVL